MNFNMQKYVPTKASLAVGRQMLKGQKHSPTILFGVGIVGVVATAVMASRATLKLNDILEESTIKKELIEDRASSDIDTYSQDDATRDLKVLKVITASSIIKLYGPAVSVGLISVTCLAGSHHILTTRNAGMMAAYAALEKGFNEYRDRVRDEVGDDKERHIRFGSEESIIVNDDGVETRGIRVGDMNPSVYARFFDETSNEWNRFPEYNRIFLRSQQNYMNDKLNAKGHVFLNEVYDALGIERSRAGAVVGWILSKDGDNYIDFGVFADESQRIRDFVNGREGSILLDFNVQGQIFDKI